MNFGFSLGALDLKDVEISSWQSLRPVSVVRVVLKNDLVLLVKNKSIVDLSFFIQTCF